MAVKPRHINKAHPAYMAGFAAGKKAAAPAPNDTAKPPTMAEIKQMGHDEINARWDEIHPVLKANDAA